MKLCRLVLALALVLLSACSSVVGNHPFSRLPKSDFGKPEPAGYFVSVTPHPWLIILNREGGSVTMRIFVHRTGKGWEGRGVYFEAEFPKAVVHSSAGVESWTLVVKGCVEGVHQVIIRAKDADGSVLQESRHVWRVLYWKGYL